MLTKGYTITITTSEGLTEKRTVKRLGEAFVILSTDNWSKAQITPLFNECVQHKTRKTKNRPVQCIETGEAFISIRECSAHYGIPYKAIWNSMTHGTARKGYHFRDYKGD